MGSAIVCAWAVHLKSRGSGGAADRMLLLAHSVSAEGPRSKVVFRDGAGVEIAGRGSHVEAVLPLGDYTAWLDLLRQDRHVLVSWEAATESSPATLRISTASRGPGSSPCPVDAR